jgi:hypothetical protein
MRSRTCRTEIQTQPYTHPTHTHLLNTNPLILHPLILIVRIIKDVHILLQIFLWGLIISRRDSRVALKKVRKGVRMTAARVRVSVFGHGIAGRMM